MWYAFRTHWCEKPLFAFKTCHNCLSLFLQFHVFRQLYTYIIGIQEIVQQNAKTTIPNCRKAKRKKWIYENFGLRFCDDWCGLTRQEFKTVQLLLLRDTVSAIKWKHADYDEMHELISHACRQFKSSVQTKNQRDNLFSFLTPRFQSQCFKNPCSLSY